jgi:hypothetical protein
MLLLLVVWCLLAACCAPIGAAILRVSHAEASFEEDPLDYGILSIWLGLLAVGCVFLALALVIPLSPWCALLPLAAAALLLSREPLRSSVLRPIPSPLAIACVLTILGLAYHGSTVLVDAYDTGLYHQQAISWLSHFGLVKGLTWLHFRLGWPSSWFALAAVLNHGPIEGRGSGMVGEFAIVLVLVHFLGKLYRVAAALMRPADWYLLAAYPILLAAAWYWHFDLSSGTDVPGWTLTVLIGWTALIVSKPQPNARAFLLPMIVAALAVACKLTVLPLIPAGLLFAIAHAKGRWWNREWITLGAAAVAVPVLTLGAANLIISGCPMYPSTLGCLTTSWSIPVAMAQYVTSDIRDASRWLGIPGSEIHGYRWLAYWVIQKEKLAAVLVTIVATIVVLLPYRRGRRECCWMLLFGYAGLAMIAVNAPNLRYGLGFFLLFPAALAAAVLPVREWRLPRLRAMLAPCFAIVITAGILVTDRADRIASSNQPWLLPAALPSGEGQLTHIYNRYENRQVPIHFLWRTLNNFHFRLTFPVDQCWDLPLPCTPFVLDENFRLADPARGLAAGFVSIPRSQPKQLGPHLAQ